MRLRPSLTKTSRGQDRVPGTGWLTLCLWLFQGDKLMRLPSHSYDTVDLVRNMSIPADGPEQVITADEYLHPQSATARNHGGLRATAGKIPYHINGALELVGSLWLVLLTCVSWEMNLLCQKLSIYSSLPRKTLRKIHINCVVFANLPCKWLTV